MNRAVLSKTNVLIAAFVVMVGLSGGTVLLERGRASDMQAVTSAQRPLIELSYHGQNGVDALTLLKQHATVATKHYSFGDMVVSINGTAGSGPKYWTFYVNGNMAQTSAGAYITQASDVLTWKLQ